MLVARKCFMLTAFIVTSVFQISAFPDEDLQDEVESTFWQNVGRQTLAKALNVERIDSPAKNVIFFLGDGMGISTVTAIRIYKGQKKGNSGKHSTLSFDNFPHVSLSKTYALDKIVADSANTATAFFCGVKANVGTLGVNGRVSFDNCSSSLDPKTHVDSILQWAQNAGMATGFVTTKRVTDATPAALYSHVANRSWEADSPDKNCSDIAMQLVRYLPGRDINVIFGGGRGPFLPNTTKDNDGSPGERTDDKNLIEEWKTDKLKQNRKHSYITTYKDFKDLKPYNVDYVLGLFNTTNLPFITERSPENPVPSLVEMTKKAIEILSKGSRRFFLMVEGGLIDTGHHQNSARRSLEEGVEFDEAIDAALGMTNKEETLIVVTADHSHPFTLSGNYPLWDSDILGLGGINNIDNKTMTILSYANGPGHTNVTKNLTQEEVLDHNYIQNALYPMTSDTHGGEDVSVYALGPMAHLFHGVHEESYIPYAIGYAACIGEDKRHCATESSARGVKPPITLYLIAILMFWTFCE